MSEELNKETLKQCDTSALLSMVIYRDLKGYEGSDLTTLLDQEELWNGAEEERKILLDAIENDPSIGKITLAHESSSNGFDKKIMIAATFQDPATGDVYVTYRGTDDGKWVHNAVGLSEKESQVQREACKYYDAVVTELDGIKEGKLIVTGHSQGGNSAQYVAINSENGYLIDRVYSIDGQGFSEEGIEESFAYKLNPNYYESQRQKMYSINGENDYVHDLGIPIIPEDHTYFVRTSRAKGIGDLHSISFMLSQGRLDWYDENGNHDGGLLQGPTGEFAKVVSRKLMAMDPDARRECAMSAMTLAEVLLPYDGKRGGEYLVGTGDSGTASHEDFEGFYYNGIPLILEALHSAEGRSLVESIVRKRLEETYEKNGPWGVFWDVVAGTGIMITLGPALKVLEIQTYLSLKLLGSVREVLRDLKDTILEYAIELCDSAVKIFKKAGTWINRNLNPGMRYSNGHACIKVDTEKLKGCANRLVKVNNTAIELGRRMDGLYLRMGLLDLWNLMQADLLTGYSWKVQKCIWYLRKTADDFETADRNIGSKI